MKKIIYVALLRGINVGGNNKVDMELLKASFEKVGMSSVKTYINTGNIIFTSNLTAKKEIEDVLHKAILATFSLDIRVLVKTYKEMSKIIKALPTHWTNDKEMKSDVLFLWEEIDKRTILSEIGAKPLIDAVLYVKGAILFMVDRKNVTKSGLIQLAKSKLYKQMTVRNVNTTRKIFTLMQDLD